MTQNITEDNDQAGSGSLANKSPLKWILLAAVLTLLALIYFKDKAFLTGHDAASPLFNPPAKSEQQLDKEKTGGENKLREKF